MVKNKTIQKKNTLLTIATLILVVLTTGCGKGENEAANVASDNNATEITATEAASDEQDKEETEESEEATEDASYNEDSDLSQAKVGDVVKFGMYEYLDGEGNSYGYGVEPVLWDVIDAEDGKLLLISHYCIEEHAYNQTGAYDDDVQSTNWEESEIRAYLNEEILNDMFSEAEQEKILSTTLSNPTSEALHKEYTFVVPYLGSANSCGDTEDKLFLLSYEELIDYYGDFVATNESGKEKEGHWYCLPAGATLRDDTPDCYWLRSQGCIGYCSMVIGGDGYVSDQRVNRAVPFRPAMWVTINED